MLYLGSVTWIDYGLSSSYENQIEKICTGDMAAGLLDGKISLADAFRKNVGAFLESRHILEKQLKIVVTILSKQGDILYPAGYSEERPSFNAQDDLKLAAENFRILNEGLDIRVSVTLPPNSPLSYALLAFLVSLSVGFFYVMYRKGMENAKHESELNESKWASMLEREDEYRAKLDNLTDERKDMENRVNEMKDKLTEIRLSEDSLVEEIVQLEKLLEENAKLQNAQNAEIEALKSLIEKNEGEKKARLKKKIKGQDATEKRFKTLYKNLDFNDKAIEGFRDLEEDMKLKCEEIIHLLNDEPDKVIIKRKVFGKKNRETVFEVIFSYNGRLYFRKVKEGRTEVLAIGTKNTQDRELEFLDKL